MWVGQGIPQLACKSVRKGEKTGWGRKSLRPQRRGDNFQVTSGCCQADRLQLWNTTDGVTGNRNEVLTILLRLEVPD